MKPASLLNRRVIFKLHGMNPFASTVLQNDETGYWIRGALLPNLDQSNCSMPESDVRHLEFTRIQWLRLPRDRS